MDDVVSSPEKSMPRKSRSKQSSPKQKLVIQVAELFAGVGGFRLGLEGRNPSARKRSRFRAVWANQWEPSTRIQHAYEVYRTRFPDAHDYKFPNEDINRVIEKHFEDIPDHDLLCGGFPCQDYSVAKTLNQAAGIVGKKGVLWWSIHSILEKKESKRPNFVFLENVDRLLSSPAKQRGRDFAIMLASLADLGYAVEWRVVNAADYGFAQRRRRIFIVGYHKSTDIFRRLKSSGDGARWIDRDGILARALPVEPLVDLDLDADFELDNRGASSARENLLVHLTKRFNVKAPSTTPFANSGVMVGGKVWTRRTTPRYSGKQQTLGKVLVAARRVPDEYFIDASELPRWEYLKGKKSADRIHKKSGKPYSYDEGAMAFPDPLDKPSRTIITGEGGKTPSRFKHVVKQGRRYRRLTPVELEKLNGFPPNHTKLEGISDIKRAFFMGNALVVGVVERISKVLGPEILKDKRKR